MESILSGAVVRDRTAEIGAALRQSNLVVIRNAVREAFAERVWQALDGCDTWRPYEGADEDFHYRHHNLYEPDRFPPVLHECRLFFESELTKRLVAGLSGRDCSGPLQFSASWYMPGDYSLPHDDGVEARDGVNRRQVAFIWHLTRDWDRRWGGHLYWGPSQEMLVPSFNCLFLFAIGPGQRHFVAPVAANAVGKRLTINGWWTGPERYSGSPAARERAPLEISAEAR